MHAAFCSALLLLAQAIPTNPLGNVQQSHIIANVPAPENFERYLSRDLVSYFSDRLHHPVVVAYEPLRLGPTQSGVAYPKYYLWVKIDGGNDDTTRGAVRVAAVEQTHFVVTDFVSERVLRSEFDQALAVFPAAVCETIKIKLAAGP